MKTTIMAVVLLCIAVGMMNAQTPLQQQERAQKHMMKEDSAAVNALVMYPDTIRVDIFEACKYPSAIVSIATLQKNSSADFVTLISGYTAVEQEDCWNLSRYPGLITRLAQEGKRSIDDIIAILKDYPDEIRETAMWYGTKQYDLIKKMDALQTKTDGQFDQTLADYPSVTQDALRELVLFPEIISLLNDHLGLTVRVGDNYRRDPNGLIHQADSINLAVTRQNAEDAASWKESVEQNPEEAEDLKNAATDYATELGYTQEEVNTAPDPVYVETYVCPPYRYWFGYPTWYPYSYWYPYPFWFDCGFHFDRHGRIVIIGPPSRYFTRWYYYRPNHLRRYPHLCDLYVGHYFGRRRIAGENSTIVRGWVRERRDYLPKDFSTNKKDRIELIKQIAQLDIDVQNHSGGKPGPSIDRVAYLEQNPTVYPALTIPKNPVLDESRPTIQDPILLKPEKQPTVRIFKPLPALDLEPKRTPERLATPDVEQRPVFQPSPKNVNAADNPDANKTETQRPSYRPAPSVQPSRPRPAVIDKEPATPTYNFNRVQNAQEYQRNIWEQTQPAPRPQVQQVPRPAQVDRPQPAPPPRVQQPAPRPAQAVPAKPSKDQ